MTLDQWDDLIVFQLGRCAACGDELRGDRNQGVHVDHDHATGEVRGLLCFHCNVAEGHLKGDPDRAFRLAVYLLTTTDVLTSAGVGR
jgi:hypothetical protein